MKNTMFTPVHAAAQPIGCLELPDDIPDDHTNGVGRAGQREARERQPERSREAENGRREPVARDRQSSVGPRAGSVR